MIASPGDRPVAIGVEVRSMADDATAGLPACLLAYVAGLKSHDVPGIGRTVSPDLAFTTPARTLDKRSFLSFLRARYAGFPDWSYRHDPIEERGEGRFAIRWRQGGTHSATLALPGFPAVPATGRSVEIPPHFFFYRVAGDSIIEIRPAPVPGGAPRGIFEQIGVALPPL